MWSGTDDPSLSLQLMNLGSVGSGKRKFLDWIAFPGINGGIDVELGAAGRIMCGMWGTIGPDLDVWSLLKAPIIFDVIVMNLFLVIS